MKIAFVDLINWDYSVKSVKNIALGGSQSALCYLAMNFASLEHDVFLLNDISAPTIFGGVACLPINSVNAGFWEKFDFIIFLNCLGSAKEMRKLCGKNTQLLLWIHQADDVPIVQELENKEEKGLYDYFVFISEWQKKRYVEKFDLDLNKIVVFRNSIGDVFNDLLDLNESILSVKNKPLTLAYTSTPFRGLKHLIDIFPRIQNQHPDVKLKIFSSMKVYQVSSVDDDAEYGPMYEIFRQMEGVEYIGSIPQEKLAEELKKVAVLIYPNTFEETSCIAVMEGMASGCYIVSSDLGALPETTAGFGHLISLENGIEIYKDKFVNVTIDILNRLKSDSRGEIETHLTEQVQFCNQTYTWTVRSHEWLQSLYTIKAYRYYSNGDYLIAAETYEEAIEKYPQELTYYWYLGLIYLLEGYEEEFQNIWLSVFLQGNLEEVEQWTIELIDLLEVEVRKNITTQKIRNAKIIYEAIFIINPDYENLKLSNNLVEALSLFASALSFNHEYETALSFYLEALNLDHDHAISWHSLALNYYCLEQYSEAEESIQKAIELNRSSSQNFYALGMILEKKNNVESAIIAYNRAIENDSNFLDAYTALGSLYFLNKSFAQALESYEKFLEKSRNECQSEILHRIGTIYLVQEDKLADRYLGYAAYYIHDYDTAIKHFEKYLSDQTEDFKIYLDLGKAYVQINQTVLAIEVIEKAIVLFPENLSLKIFNQSILPVIYQDAQEIEFYRHRFSSLLSQLLKNHEPKTIEQANDAFIGIDKRNTFYLAYQSKNDLLLQKQYGQYIHTTLRTVYPQWCQKLTLDPDLSQRKIRIGYVSQYLDGLGQLYLGWLKYCDKQKFEIYTYDLSGKDANESFKVRDEFKVYSQNMWYLNRSGNLTDVCEQIISDQLDILVFPEIGVAPKLTPLSCLRLAPIQCTTWAHPVTSGSPTIDYFLSSDLMEPVNGDEHYSEKLVRLPNIAFAISRPEFPEISKQRSDFGLREDALIYWCCQSLFKYLPQHDYIFPSIAHQNHQCQFVFIESDHSSVVTDSFKVRIQKAFMEFDLDYKQYCIFLPRLNKKEFILVTQLADIFLDCLSWSGGFTTRDAISCGLPVVTCPGQLMRARHSDGILQMLGITETIAQTESEYIQIAIRLGLDSEWRKSIKEKIITNSHRIFEDQECITALETFFLEAVQK